MVMKGNSEQIFTSKKKTRKKIIVSIHRCSLKCCYPAPKILAPTYLMMSFLLQLALWLILLTVTGATTAFHLLVHLPWEDLHRPLYHRGGGAGRYWCEQIEGPNFLKFYRPLWPRLSTFSLRVHFFPIMFAQKGVPRDRFMDTSPQTT